MLATVVSHARLAPIVFGIATIWMGQATALAQTPPPGPSPRCEYVAGDRPEPTRIILFPDDDLFRPPLADPKEPRNGFDYRGARGIDSDAGSARAAGQEAGITVGGNVGVWARKTSACHGVQISMIGGVFAQFNLDASSRDLINADYVIGAQIAMRTNRISSRIRVFHQSSHLGEDFFHQNPSASDPNFGFQALEGLISLDGERWRAYGGAGYLWFMNDDGTSALVHAGAEFRARDLWFAMVRPVAGVDVTSLQSRSWGLTTSATGGVEWTSPAETRRMRLVILFTNGYSPFGQASVQRQSRTLGLQWQIEF
jgi:hypothetical protein